MTRLPERPDLDHVKKQAKDLLAACRRGDPRAFARFRDALPAAAGRSDEAIGVLGLRLHDAQSCIAREYGFPSWAELRGFVEARRALADDRPGSVLAWLRLVYAGDVAGGMNRARPEAASRMLEERPGLVSGDPALACAVGDLGAIRAAMAADPGWLGRPGGPLALPPLIAVTHSGLVRLPAFRERLLAAAKLLLDAGADPNRTIGSRSPPGSVEEPSRETPLSALYGAAGQNRDPAMTALLLEAGADPNDGESLYHSLENPACTRLLLEAGARVTGTNALYRVLDLDDVETLRLLLAHGGDPNEGAGGGPTNSLGRPLFWAIRRRRSPAHIEALLAAGADPSVRMPDGTGAEALALRFGLMEVAALLAQRTGGEALSEEDRFVAACAAGDAETARSIRARRPDLPSALPEARLRLLPDLAGAGAGDAVRVMVELGWPIAIAGGDWGASALNHAVFRGDADLVRFLLAHGASWEERHGFGDNACGTLAWASLNEPEGGGDWVGCAEALLASGMPAGRPDTAGTDGIVVAGQVRRFSDEVGDVLLGR
ncbi:ankyrin repeat domain-containing protein [Enterovirga rhinocerotis]|uniref:Ankyrin repeat protein n=1 Tax=Enterovirga rhinocerotis TaxID=1339210 RepID=A0A4R7BVA8_9HYPH|nr:ankyrin repeat domain-containing protein [Enterovirga rhinocerotis]TDR89778.1 hypothetical protein EV668_2613 [Enterovirga rhinocerotis]